MIRDKDEVEDLTQEAFIKAFMSLSSFNDEFAFSTWLYKIATNNCIDYIRRKKLQTFSIDKPIESKESDYTYELPDSTYEPDQELIDRQRKKLLEDAINSLPAKYRHVIHLRHVEEKEYQEIAAILKLPLGTVKAHIFRAVKCSTNICETDSAITSRLPVTPFPALRKHMYRSIGTSGLR